MTAPVKMNFKVYQGSTFSEVLRWESATKVYVPISSITQSAPMTVTTSSPVGCPIGWRTRITNVAGMKEVNCATDTYYTVTDIVGNNNTYNAINSLGFSTYTSGGVIEYNEPVDLTGYTARMQVRGKLEDTDIIKELTTENGGIAIDNVLKTITITISAADTAAMTFSQAVYSLELVNGSVVTPFINGSLSLVKEVTR